MSTTSQKRLATRSPVSKGYPITAIARDAGKSLWSLVPLLVGFTLYSGTLLAEGLVGPAFRLWPDSIGSIAIGLLILGSYATALGYIATRTGLNTASLARLSFGNVGSRWVDFILGLTQISWYAWGSALIADLLNNSFGVPSYLNWLTILICTYLFCATAYFGYRVTDWLERLAPAIMLFLIFWSLIVAMSKVGGFQGLLLLEPTKQLELGELLTIIIGTFISGGTQGSKWSRFTLNGRTAVITFIIALLCTNGFFIFYGAIASLFQIDVDIVNLIAQQGVLIWGLLLLFLNMWTTQENTLSAFWVSATNIFGTKKRTAFVLVGVTFALALAWSKISGMFVPYLLFLGTFIPPIGGIVMSDYWLYRKGQLPSPNDLQPPFNWAGIISYILACPIAYFWPGIKPINGILAAIVIYFLLSKFISFISRQRKTK